MDVWTGNEETEETLNAVLLDQDDGHEDYRFEGVPWWERPQHQSDLGILIKVVEGPTEIDSMRLAARGATELLLYAAALGKPKVEGLPTPPRSSSPVPSQHEAHSTTNLGQQLRLYALPISRNVAPAAGSYSNDISSISTGDAWFLPLQQHPEKSASGPSSPKRRKLSDVFDNATQQRQKFKGYGGERISRAMSNASDPSIGNSKNVLPQKETVASSLEPGDESVQPANPRRQNVSRSSSFASLPSIEPSRPCSRRGSFVPNKRSSLHRVESVVSGLRSPSITIESDNSIEQQNKTSLSRIIMTGMRMYGLQQRKPHAKAPNASAEAPPEDEEYKLIYHQTFKAASLAFRSHFAVRQIGPDTMREVVDRLLSMFCTDPLSEAITEEHKDCSFGSQEHKEQPNPFDEPRIAGDTVKLTAHARPLSEKEKHSSRTT